MRWIMTTSRDHSRRDISHILGKVTIVGLLVASGWLGLGEAGEQPAPPTIVFGDLGDASGVSFRYESGSRGRHDLPEIMGRGVALIDADGDGWLDLFLSNGGPIVGTQDRTDPPCRFYRNNHDGTFRDMTETAGVPGPSYAMGVAVGDVDRDGHDDLFVTDWRDQRLYRNLGSGRFEDCTRRAGLASDLWSTSAALADLDRDGDLDLYVANYLDFQPAQAPFCSASDGRRDFCGPEDFPAQPDRL
jgi:enediyne biosynthesis protein E4